MERNESAPRDGTIDESGLHARALGERDAMIALDLWIELGGRGNPDAPERLREYSQSLDAALRDPARQALMDLGLSHEVPMP